MLYAANEEELLAEVYLEKEVLLICLKYTEMVLHLVFLLK